MTPARAAIAGLANQDIPCQNVTTAYPAAGILAFRFGERIARTRGTLARY